MSTITDMLKSAYRKYKSNKVYTDEARKKSTKAKERFKEEESKRRLLERESLDPSDWRESDRFADPKHKHDVYPMDARDPTPVTRNEKRALRRKNRRELDDVYRKAPKVSKVNRKNFDLDIPF